MNHSTMGATASDALDALIDRLDRITGEAHGASFHVWYSGNDGVWKWAFR